MTLIVTTLNNAYESKKEFLAGNGIFYLFVPLCLFSIFRIVKETSTRATWRQALNSCTIKTAGQVNTVNKVHNVVQLQQTVALFRAKNLQ
jgi:hypothetical protein